MIAFSIRTNQSSLARAVNLTVSRKTYEPTDGLYVLAPSDLVYTKYCISSKQMYNEYRRFQQSNPCQDSRVGGILDRKEMSIFRAFRHTGPPAGMSGGLTF